MTNEKDDVPYIFEEAYDNGDEVWQAHREKVLKQAGLLNDD